MFGFGIAVRNVNEALPTGIHLLKDHGVPTVSRGLATVRAPGPVSTVYHRPTERVLFDPVRDANPFFHLMESLWIIGGSNRVELPAYFLNSITRFSDNGLTFHGAYGYRLRRGQAGFDQVKEAIELLRKKPDTRQCVMNIWNGLYDLGVDTKDVPCNDMVMLDIVDGALNMTVCNRSNDVIWGAYGANAVQFSMLQEFIAASVGVKVGYYVQMSNNYHVYADNPYWLHTDTPAYQPSDFGTALYPESFPLAMTPEEAGLFNDDCVALCMRAEDGADLLTGSFESPFFLEVVDPAIRGYNLYKQRDFQASLLALSKVQAHDWSIAMSQWVQRRAEKAA